jgi:hypothetical protein
VDEPSTASRAEIAKANHKEKPLKAASPRSLAAGPIFGQN